MNVRGARRAGVTATLIMGLALIAVPTAHAETAGGIVGRNAVHQVAHWIAEHSGTASSISTGGNVASLACAQAAPGCALLANFYYNTYQVYGNVITTASDRNACVEVFAGDTMSTSDGSWPYVHTVDGPSCHD